MNQDPKVIKSVYLPNSIWHEAQIQAASKGVSLNKYIELLIREKT